MWLIASDLHLTDAPRDSYRNGIFDYLAEQANANNASDIFLLGDITDRKDHHSGAFINFLWYKFMSLSDKTQARIHILQGNHDYTDPENPTLGFLSLLKNTDIFWYEPSNTLVGAAKSGQSVVMFPFCRNEDDFKATLYRVPDAEFAAAFFHQTFRSAKASSGIEMDGIPVGLLEHIKAKRYFSGDIHVPQTIGPVEYVGSPYQIRFGDDFKGRVIAYDVDKDEMKSLHYPTIRKTTLVIKKPSDLSNANLSPGDQVKIRMALSRDEMADWKTIEADIVAAVKDACADLCGVEITEADAQVTVETKATASSDPQVVYGEFCTSNKIDGDVKSYGEAYLT